MIDAFNSNVYRIPCGIQKIKNEVNAYIYGNGKYAAMIMDELHKFGIKLKGCLISSEYMNSQKTFYSLNIYKTEDILNNLCEDIVIVAGFNILIHKELLNRLINNPRVATIYVVNGCNVLWENDFEFIHPKVHLVDNYYNGLLERNLCREYYDNNRELFNQTYQWLEDDKSKITMKAYIRGHVELDEYPLQDIWKKDDILNQYFPEDIIKLSNQEVFVDCGAYTGDTLEDFLKRVTSFEKYYAFEPDETKFEQIEKKMATTKLPIKHIKKGVWNKKGTLSFSATNGCGTICEGAEAIIEVDTIDNTIEEKVTFIKMDIEGAELEALQGASKTIIKNKPTLAICVYHKREDLITIPQYIKELVPEYKFYLRGHYVYASELVLYAICDEREDERDN